MEFWLVLKYRIKYFQQGDKEQINPLQLHRKTSKFSGDYLFFSSNINKILLIIIVAVEM